MRESEGPLLSFICSDSGLRWAINPQDNCPPKRWEMSSLCSVQANVYASQMKVEPRDIQEVEERGGEKNKAQLTAWNQSWTDIISNGLATAWLITKSLFAPQSQAKSSLKVKQTHLWAILNEPWGYRSCSLQNKHKSEHYK